MNERQGVFLAGLVGVILCLVSGCWSQYYWPTKNRRSTRPPVNVATMTPVVVEPVVTLNTPATPVHSQPKPVFRTASQKSALQPAPTLVEVVRQNQKREVETGKHQRQIVISIDEQRLYALEDGQIKWEYICSTSSTGIILFGADPWDDKPHDHVGTFKILEKRGEKRFVSTYNAWMYWPMRYVFGHFIHGTDEEAMLGQPASHGCVRISKVNAKQLYAWTHIGDQITIKKEPYLESP